MTVKLVGTKSQYSRYSDYSITSVGNFGHRGLLVYTDDGMIDFEATDKKIAETNTRPRKNRSKGHYVYVDPIAPGATPEQINADIDADDIVLDGTVDRTISSPMIDPSMSQSLAAAVEDINDAYMTHRANKLKYDAERSRLAAEVLAGKLIYKDEVRFAVDDLCLTFVSALTNIESQLGPRVAPITDINEVNAAIRDVADGIIDSVRRIIESRLPT